MKTDNRSFIIVTLLAVMMLAACSTKSPEPIKLNVDNCDQCRMTITDLKFGTELITDKGRVYKFDDLKCLVKYKKEQNLESAYYFVPDHNQPENLVKAESAVYVKGDNVKTPMNGFIATFAKEDEASAFAAQNDANIITWEEVIK